MKSTDINAWLKTQDALRTFVYKKVKDKTVAEDIVQDAFLKVYKSIETLKESEKVTGWIFQIARNLIIDHFRKQSKSIKIQDLDWETSESNYNECVSSCLTDMLKHLPDKYREAIELTEFHDLSQTELAERLQISYSGAKSRVQRARQLLREKMDKAYNIKVDAYGNAVVCKDRLPCGCD